jgi:hypothetical protein
VAALLSPSRKTSTNKGPQGPRVDTQHPSYREMALIWQRIRDCIAGGDQVRLQGTAYLPQLAEQEPIDYELYKRRAKYVNFTRATLEMRHGFIFRKDPQFEYPGALDDFVNDVTLSGRTWDDYCRDIVEEVLSVGRCGTLIDWDPDEKRPYCVKYRTEQIINWKVRRVLGQMNLTLLVLQEEATPDQVLFTQESDPFTHVPVVQWRVYRLDTTTDVPFVVCELYQRDNKGGFVMFDQTMPSRRGTLSSNIPFVFHGATNCEAEANDPPLAAISDLNIAHYRQSADLENGRHFCGLPQPYALGFEMDDEDKPMIGSSSAWVCDNTEAKVGYLEFHGDGLGSLEKGIIETEQQLAALGARMLEQQKGDEAYQTVLMRQSGQAAALTQSSNASSTSLTSVLQWANWWLSTVAVPQSAGDDISVELNTDFIETKVERGEVTEMAGLVQGSLMSRQTFHEWLQSVEIMPADRSLEDEQALIEAQPPPGMNQPAGGPGQEAGAGAAAGGQSAPGAAEAGAGQEGPEATGGTSNPVGNEPDLSSIQVG